MVFTIGHRGASGHALENTMPAFKKAIDSGADAIECDVRITSDGKIVVMHDADIGRTTFGQGLVKKLTLEELYKTYTLNREKVPLFEDVLKFVRGKCIIKVDIKEKGFEGEIINALERYAMKEHSIITTELPAVIKRTRTLDDSILIERGGLKEFKPVNRLIRHALSVKANVISPYYTIASKSLIDAAHEAGLAVDVWTVNDEKTAQLMLKIGADAITTDFPEIITKML